MKPLNITSTDTAQKVISLCVFRRKRLVTDRKGGFKEEAAKPYNRFVKRAAEHEQPEPPTAA